MPKTASGYAANRPPHRETATSGALHPGDQTVVTGSGTDAVASGRNLSHEDTHLTLFYGIATLGANRLDVVVSNLKVGDNLNPVSVVVFDNDAMEGLNLPNNPESQCSQAYGTRSCTEH